MESIVAGNDGPGWIARGILLGVESFPLCSPHLRSARTENFTLLLGNILGEKQF
jgi:hypothetical protein